MEVLQLNNKQIKVLLKKAYEWLAKVNSPKRNHRINYYKTIHSIKKFKKFMKAETTLSYIPNNTELLLILVWFERCPPKSSREQLVFTYVGLIYKLHKYKLVNVHK